MTNKKVISEQEEQEIIKQLNEQYGPEGEEWLGGLVTVKGDQKYYAVKAPETKDYYTWKHRNEEIDTKVMYNRPCPYTKQGVQNDLISSCIISDIKGVATVEEYKVDCQKKAMLPEILGANVVKLLTFGFDGLKKNLQ